MVRVGVLMKKVLLFLIIFFISVTNVYALNIDFHSKNVVLYNYDTDQVVFEQGADEVISIASMTKIMTALVLIENIDDLDTQVILRQEHFKGLREANASVAGFRLGQKVTYRDLLYGIILPSGADAVQTLAIEVFGSNDNLVKKMNKKVESLNLKNTHFINPVGLDAKGHYSTLKEVGIILKEALKNDIFKEIYTTRRYLTSDKSITLYSTIVAPLNMINKNATYIKGSKTGYTGLAGRCLSTLAYDEENDINYLLITAGAQEKVHPVIDAVNMYEYLFKNYSNHILVEKDEILTSVKANFSKESSVNLIAKEDVSLFYGNNLYDENKITYEYDIPKNINKILKQGTKVGTASIYYNEELISTIDLLIEKNMELSIFKIALVIVVPISIIFCVIILFKKKRINNLWRV